MKKSYLFSACLLGFLTVHTAGRENADCLEKEKAIASIETAETLLTEAIDSAPYCDEDGSSTDDSKCGRTKHLAYIEVSKKIMSDIRQNFPSCSKPIEEKDKIVKEEKRSHCSEILASGHKVSGVYTIWVGESSSPEKPLQVYCDMDTDGGGWTVIQRRGNYGLPRDFYLDWESYKKGFGDILEEFWLGNENIRLLCLKGCQIRFDLKDESGQKAFAHYKNFNLLKENYRMTINGFSGNAGDQMYYLDNWHFSTKDKGDTNIASYYKGGWWYRYNVMCNLNGEYQPGAQNERTVHWYTWRGLKNLSAAEIKVRPTYKESPDM